MYNILSWLYNMDMTYNVMAPNCWSVLIGFRIKEILIDRYRDIGLFSCPYENE